MTARKQRHELLTAGFSQVLKVAAAGSLAMHRATQLTP
jgi:hypothetical protein